MSSKKDKKTDDEPEIDTKGKKITLEPGGKLYFHCLAARELGKKPDHWTVYVFIDGEKVYKTKESSGHKWEFDDQPNMVNLPADAKLITIVLKERGLVGESQRGEIRIEADSLYNGYPHDEWYQLRNKEGKDDSKIKGALHLRLLYVAKGKEMQKQEYKYPLHSLIRTNRLDLFKKKLDEMEVEGKFPEDDEKITPLCLAARDGKAGFVKLLVEGGSKIMNEVDPEGRNAIHLAAANGHPTIIHYLAIQKGVDLNKADKGSLSPLHLAAENNKPDCCVALVKRGANVDVKNQKGNTPLIHALLVPSGAHHAVKALVECGSDIRLKNSDGLCAWEISQRKEICQSSNNRASFMSATDVVDPREYEIELPNKQRFKGKNLSTEWSTATQFIVTCKKPMQVTLLAYSNTRTPECAKQVGFCVVKGSEKIHNMPSFQQEGIGFGGLKPFIVDMDPEHVYHLITYCTKEELNGDFGICAFYAKDNPPLECKEGTDWAHHEIVNGSWKGKLAGGSANFKANPYFQLKANGKGKEEIEIFVMLRQIQKDVSNIFAEGGERIVPTKYYVGYYVFDEDVTEELTKTQQWMNSFDVYKRLHLKPGKKVTIIPTTRKEGETMDFELHAFSDHDIALKQIEK